MKNFIFFAVFMLLSAGSQAEQIKFLEEKTAFCYTEKSLANYLKLAEKRDLVGMNQLIMKGECSFVPDGQVLLLKNYRIDVIANTKVVAFEMDNLTGWTFNALVQTADFSNL